MLHFRFGMSIWPVQTALFFKVGVCILPVMFGMYAAESAARRRCMNAAARLWSAAAGLCLAAVAMCLLTALLVWVLS